jgi:single-stranded-DNA-specific exonuclease
MLMAAVKKHYQNLGLVSPQEGPSLVENLPLVAIGAIADMAPLCGANRIMVRHGLDLLASSSHPGLTALKQISRLAPQNRVSPRDVGFRMAPRLNAAGRLGSADPALELLLAEDEGLARTLAARLENLNRERHQLQNRLCGEALEKLEMEARPDDRTVVLAGEGWPRGILGLAASRVAETTGKPTVLFSLENGLAVGSGRTSGKFNLYSALNASRHLYTAFGGHAQAAGLTMPAKNLDDFRISFEDAASQEGDFLEEMEHWIDFRVALGDLPALDRPLAAMEPFGQDNPQPLVMVSQAHVLDARPTDSGGESHIKMVIGDGLIRQKIIGFNLAPRLYEVGRELDVLLTPDFSEYKGQSSTQWRLVDFRLPQQ